MAGRISFLATLLASALTATAPIAVRAVDNPQATADPASLAELDLAAETRGDAG